MELPLARYAAFLFSVCSLPLNSFPVAAPIPYNILQLIVVGMWTLLLAFWVYYWGFKYQRIRQSTVGGTLTLNLVWLPDMRVRSARKHADCGASYGTHLYVHDIIPSAPRGAQLAVGVGLWRAVRAVRPAYC